LNTVEPKQSTTWQHWTLRTFIDELSGRGESTALAAVEGDHLSTLSYVALADRARALASGLVQIGVRPGEPVALLAPNGIDWVVARLGLAAAGAVAVALDDLATEVELKAWLAESGCRRVLTSADHVPVLQGIDPGLDLTVVGDHPAAAGTRRWTDLFASSEPTLPPLDPTTPAMLVYTSGTTGAAKSFFLTHANLAANLGALATSTLVGRDDRVLLPLPLHHVYPFVVGLLTPLSCGACVVFPERPTGPEILHALRAGEASIMVGVPRLYEAMISGLRERLRARGAVVRVGFNALLGFAMWMRRRFGINAGQRVFRTIRANIAPMLHLLVSGGARLRPETLWPLVGLGFDVRSGYGLAETASIFAGNVPGAERFESEGKPFKGEVRIAEPDEQGIGEIQLRGPNVFAGYRDNPEANARAFTADGWFRTADVGWLDRDGFLFVAGRGGDVIVLGGGKKVDPEELERLYGASQQIREIAVLERGGALVALIVPDLGQVHGGSTIQMADAMRVALADRAAELPSYQRLAGFALTRQTLPRTRLGKFQRFRLPALYDAALAGEGRPAALAPTPADLELLRRTPARQLYDLLVKRYPDKPVGFDANLLLDLGIDSLEWVALSLAISEQLGLTLGEAELAGASTVRDLLNVAAGSATGVPGREEPGPPDLAGRDWIAPVGWGLTTLGWIAYGVTWIVARLCFRLQTVGLSNLPAKGPYVIVANHTSYLDAPAVAAAIGYRRAKWLYWSGDAGILFSRRWLFPLMRAIHIFPVEDQAPSRALAYAEAVLKQNNALTWFPEGWRSPDGQLLRFLPGIGELLHRVNAPVVPVYIAGSFEAMPRGRRMPRPHPIRLFIGPAIAPAALSEAIPRGEGSAQQIADRLHDAVAALGAEAGT
jgi:long-chain acyl-CoA synthetase